MSSAPPGRGGPVRPHVIGLLGGECTGKSTLARDLASALDAGLVTEALREFVAERGRPPHASEQASVIATQIARENAAISEATALRRRWVVADPCALMTAIYSITYFADGSLFPDALEHQSAYDLVFWCRPDLPWAADTDAAQRDGPRRRTEVDRRIRRLVADGQLVAVPVSGSPADRLETCLEHVARLG